MSKKITDEDIEQGAAKVERMNKMFDKAILPILLAAAMAVFFFGALPKLIRSTKNESHKNEQTPSYTEELNMYELRSKFMDELDVQIEKAQQAGYELQPEMQGTISISKEYDDNTVVAHFYNGASSYGKVIKNGCEGIKRADMQINNSAYIRVTLTLEDDTRLTAKFDSSFSVDQTLTDSDTLDKGAVLSKISAEELLQMLELYNAELSALVE